MPEPKAQLIDPQGPIDVPGLSVTGVTTATGGFVGAVQGAATGLASTTANLSVGIVTATKFQGNTTGNVSGLADGTNINVGIITSTSFTGDLVGNAAGLSTTTANIKAGIMSATSFAGNFTGVASGITGTPNIVVGIMTGTLNGDGSSLTGIAATNWIANNVTANSSTTTVDLSDGNVVKFTQTSNTTVSFANTGTSNIVSFIRPAADYTLTWPSAIKWDGGAAPTLNTLSGESDVVTLITRDEGVTWYGWETVNQEYTVKQSAYVWGLNVAGSLGLNQENVYYSSPVQLPGIWNGKSSGGAGYESIYDSSFLLKVDKTLWAWGYNMKGVLGQNNTTQYSSPVQVGSNSNWALVYNQGYYGVVSAVKTDGTLWSWGRNDMGNIGQNNRTQYSSPVQIPGTTWSGEKGKLGGAYNITAIKTDGTLWAWGNNTYGQLGHNNQTQYSSPVQVGSDTTWKQYTGGIWSQSFAIKTDGTLWSWGYGTYGGLAQNNTQSYSSPRQVGSDNTWAVVSQSYYAMAMATKTDGTLWAWGSGSPGSLANNISGNTARRSSPIQIPGTNWGTTINDIAGGEYGNFARKTDGTLWAWGMNNAGKLGQNEGPGGNSGAYSSPVQIPGTWDGIDVLNGRSPIAYKNL